LKTIFDTMTESVKYTLSEINALPPTNFHKVFINVIEFWSEAAVFVSALAPFPSLEAIVRAFEDYLMRLNIEKKVRILRQHPDLAGKLAESGDLSVESTAEQQQAGLANLSMNQKQELNELNEEYKVKFGFPFVICVRETNKLEAILSAMKLRLNNTMEQETQTGIDEVKKICRLRIQQIVE
jgi:2-oxo-4-hydroxy-4-carboxy-5-ureidoimidazoline decarboxylase